MGRQDLRWREILNSKKEQRTKCRNAAQNPKHTLANSPAWSALGRAFVSKHRNKGDENQTTMESCILHAPASSSSLHCTSVFRFVVQNNSTGRIRARVELRTSTLQLPDLPQQIRSPDLFFKSKSACVWWTNGVPTAEQTQDYFHNA
jgi:hypothetical protein